MNDVEILDKDSRDPGAMACQNHATVAIDSGPLSADYSGPTNLNVYQSGADITLSLSTTIAGGEENYLIARLDTDTAHLLANALDDGRAFEGLGGTCFGAVNVGLLYNDIPKGRALLSVDTDGELSITYAKEASVTIEVGLTDAEQTYVAAELRAAAEDALDAQTAANSESTGEPSRVEQFLTSTTVRGVAGAGIGLAVAGVVFTRVMNQVASVDPQQIDSVGAPLPLPSLAVVGLAVGFAVVMVLGMNRGDIIGGGGR